MKIAKFPYDLQLLFELYARYNIPISRAIRLRNADIKRDEKGFYIFTKTRNKKKPYKRRVGADLVRRLRELAKTHKTKDRTMRYIFPPKTRVGYYYQLKKITKSGSFKELKKQYLNQGVKNE